MILKSAKFSRKRVKTIKTRVTINQNSFQQRLIEKNYLIICIRNSQNLGLLLLNFFRPRLHLYIIIFQNLDTNKYIFSKRSTNRSYQYIVKRLQQKLMLQKTKKDGQNAIVNYDLRKCIEHRKANSYGMPLNFKQKCPCCCKYSAKQSLTVNFSPVKIYYTGSQLPSYLIIIKVFGILFTILSLGFALPLTIINYNGNGCTDTVNCTNSFLLKISAFNSFNQARRLYAISYVSILLFILFILSLLLIRKLTKLIEKEIDEVDLFPSPYSVYLKLPKDYGNQNTIWREIQKWWRRELKCSENKMESLFPELFKRNESQQQWKQMRKQREQVLKYQEKVQKTHCKSKIIQNILFFYKEDQTQPFDEIKLKQMSIHHRRKTQIQEAQGQTKQFTDCKFCLLIFKKKSYAQFFSKKTTPSILQKILFTSRFRQFCLKKSDVEVEEDVYPSQIFWQNQPLGKSEHLKSQLLSYLFIFLSFVFNSGMFSGISYLLNHSLSDNDDDIDKIPAFYQYFYVLTSFCINGITYFFNKLIYRYSKNQKNYTYCHKQTSLIVKTLSNNLLSMFLMPFFTIKLMGNNFLWAQNGFLQTSNCTLLIYMLFYLFQKYISASSLFSIYSYFKMDQSQDYSQKQANQRYEKPKIKIEEKYTSILTVVFLTLVNIPFSPYIVILSAAWFLIQFWLQKLSIAYFYSQDDYHGSTLTRSVIKISQFFFVPLIISTFSVFCVYAQFNPIYQITVVTVIQTLLAIFGAIFVCSPIQMLGQKIFTWKKTQETMDDVVQTQLCYNKVAQKFLCHYQKYDKAFIRQIKNKGEHRNRQSEEISENVNSQMKQIEKNLTQSLKQQLINRKIMILQKKEAYEENEQYYEYQRKVQMRKTLPKVPIPSLLQKAPLLFNHQQTIKCIECFIKKIMNSLQASEKIAIILSLNQRLRVQEKSGESLLTAPLY